MIFNESGLRFDFGKDWVVKQYDTHRFYQGLSGRGFKAVDFIGIWEETTLVFIEVKNYKVRYKGLSEQPIQAVVNDPDKFALTIATKVEDSLRAVDAIRRYYERKWWYKLGLRFTQFVNKPTSDWLFWSRVYDLINKESAEFWFILWMETEEPQEELRTALHQKVIKGIDEITSEVFLCTVQKHPFGASIRVSELV